MSEQIKPRVIKIKSNGVSITVVDKSENDIETMCHLFSDVLLGLGYRFYEGYSIIYGKEK